MTMQHETEEGSALDPVFDALANVHRRSIISALSLQPHSISHLASREGLSLPAIHKHIKGLEAADLVVRRKVGRTNYLALNRRPLRDLQRWIHAFHPYWGSEAETLENYTAHLTKTGNQPNDKETP